MSMNRVYVASRWAAGPDLVRLVVDRLEAAGWACTHRWWTEMPSEHAAGWAASADRDLRGVAAADLVVVLAMQGRAGTGMWVELGYALGLRKPVLLWAPEAHRDLLRPSLSEACSPFSFARGVRRWCSDVDVLLDRIVEEARLTREGKDTEEPAGGWYICSSCGGRWAKDRWELPLDGSGVVSGREVPAVDGRLGAWCPAGVCTPEDRRAATERRR